MLVFWQKDGHCELLNERVVMQEVLELANVEAGADADDVEGDLAAGDQAPGGAGGRDRGKAPEGDLREVAAGSRQREALESQESSGRRGRGPLRPSTGRWVRAAGC